MKQLFHLLRFDLRRMVPMGVVYFLVLACGPWMLENHGHRWAGLFVSWWLCRELWPVLVIGLLVSEGSPGNRRSVAATRPIPWQTLCLEKLVLAMGFLWLPRLAAQILLFHQLGMQGAPLYEMAVLQTFLFEARWILILFTVGALSSGFSQSLMAVAAVTISIPLANALIFRSNIFGLRSWLELGSFPDPAELSRARTLFASFLVLALLWILGDLYRYRNRWRTLVVLSGLAVSAWFFWQAAGWLVSQLEPAKVTSMQSVDSAPVQEGASGFGEWDFTTLQTLETVLEAGEEIQQLHFLRLSLIGSNLWERRLYEHPQGFEPWFQLVHRETGRVLQASHGLGTASEQPFLPITFWLKAESASLLVRKRALVEAGGESLADFEIVWSRPVRLEKPIGACLSRPSGDPEPVVASEVDRSEVRQRIERHGMLARCDELGKTL